MENFYSQTLQDIAAQCANAGVAPLHAERLYKLAYRDSDPEPWSQDGLPKRLRSEGQTWWSTARFKNVTPHVSRYDGTIKFVVKLVDDHEIEMVLMPEKSRLTLCVSSQVGCRQACSFCHTGRMGLLRDLRVEEIVGQVVEANSWIKQNPAWLEKRGLDEGFRVSNIVFMGMGEPLDNVDAVIKSIKIMTSSLGLGIAQKRISVSTAGHLDGLESLLAALPKVPVAFSLHQATNRKRSQIMPINRRWPVEQLVEAIARVNKISGRPVLIQYTVINGVNDSHEDAENLLALLADVQVKINLIPLNEIEPTKFGAPHPDRLQAFRNHLHAGGLRVMVRYSKGQDIAGACGQLVS